MNNTGEMIQEYESLIQKIPGIISAYVVCDDAGAIIEIHILASTQRHPKQIMRDVQSALNARFKMQIDYKVISIAQLEDELYAPGENRLAIDSVETSMRKSVLSVRVALCKGEETFVGEHRGANSGLSRAHHIARATLQAVNDYLGAPNAFEVLDAQSIDTTGRKVWLVTVEHHGSGGDDLLIGTCVISGAVDESVVRATLDAVNRKINLKKAKRA